MKKLILNISSSEKIEILNTEATIISIPDIDELRIKDEKGIKILSYKQFISTYYQPNNKYNQIQF